MTVGHTGWVQPANVGRWSSATMQPTRSATAPWHLVPPRSIAITAPADVEQVAVVIVQHPGDRRVAGEGLRGGGADGRAILEVAASRVCGVGKPAGRAADVARRRACGRFRGNAGLPCGRVTAVRPGGEGFRADVHDHLVNVRVAPRRRSSPSGTPRRPAPARRPGSPGRSSHPARNARRA
jgi:hypothetical protein